MIEIVEAKRRNLDAIADIRLATQQAHAEMLPHRFLVSERAAQRKMVRPFLRPLLFWRPRLHFAFVTRQENRILGYVLFFRHSTENSSMFPATRITTVADIGVLEGYRGQGIGRCMLDEVVALARDAGSEELNAHVWSGNKSSEALFMKTGFAPEMQLMSLRLDSKADVDASKDHSPNP